MIFHILNGDSLSGQFPEEIPGEKVIFRECLVDGPVQADSEEVFWKIRKVYKAKRVNCHKSGKSLPSKNTGAGKCKVGTFPRMIQLFPFPQDT